MRLGQYCSSFQRTGKCPVLTCPLQHSMRGDQEQFPQHTTGTTFSTDADNAVVFARAILAGRCRTRFSAVRAVCNQTLIHRHERYCQLLSNLDAHRLWVFCSGDIDHLHDICKKGFIGSADQSYYLFLNPEDAKKHPDADEKLLLLVQLIVTADGM